MALRFLNVKSFFPKTFKALSDNFDKLHEKCYDFLFPQNKSYFSIVSIIFLRFSSFGKCSNAVTMNESSIAGELLNMRFINSHTSILLSIMKMKSF